jgi:hypothetical protein
VAATLWNQSAVRDAVVQAAKNVSSDKTAANPKGIEGTADAVNSLKALGLPVGWKNWNSEAGTVGTILGWLITALLVMLGAPFWYGLLTKLVSMRSSGPPPPKATHDPASATRIDAARASEAQPPVRQAATLSSALDAGAFGPLASPATT